MRSSGDAAVVADDAGPVDACLGVDLGALPYPHVIRHLEAGQLHAHLAVERVAVRTDVGLERADVFPVAVDDRAVERLAFLEQLREHVGGEVDLSFADVVEDLGLEHVDAGVDRVGEHLTPRRLLEEALDLSVGAGDDDAEVDRVLHRLERDRRHRAAAVVLVDDRAEVDVGQHVAGDDEEAFVELGARVADRTGGAERRVFRRVPHADTELGAVAEVGADVVGEERECDDDLVDAVLAQQRDDVLHHRDIRDRQHRLGRRQRQGTQAGCPHRPP